MAQLTTDAAVLAREAANFERIAGELKNVIARVESTAAELDDHWKGFSASAAQQAITRFQQAADAQVTQLNDISTNIHVASAQYATTDDERSAALASAMDMEGDRDKEHNGAQLVDWKQGPDQPLQPPAPGLPPEGVRPPVAGNLTVGPASRPSEQAKGGMSLWDEKGGEWRYDPGTDKWHNPHWDFNQHDTKFPEWQNIQIGELPPHTDDASAAPIWLSGTRAYSECPA
ncbi:WXG100 family type VII secretion target [Mycobacterium kyorinense]|uniref:WXG100 family type VII secretion target n=1 Tax=Mycobacterium kyorinense TaxID=487514 RepID=UPI00084C2CA8